jgi:hypothetical protein
MPATAVLTRSYTFQKVPIKSTKRGFAIPYPPVLRSRPLTGEDNPKDKEFDGRGYAFTWTPQRYYLGTLKYTPVGTPGFTKRVANITEVSLPEWKDALKEWRQWLRDNAEDYTSTYKAVIGTVGAATLGAHATFTPVPTVAPVVQIPTQVVNNTPLPMPSWDPNDVDIAQDLFDVPSDNLTFLPDKETFQILDASWRQAMTSGEPRHILIYGDTSTGKTEHPKIWCARNDVLWCRIDCGAFGEIYDVTGPIKAKEQNGVSVTEWIKGKTIRALADPRPAVIQLDEVNRISDVKAMNVLFPFFDSSKQSYFDDNQTWMKLNGIKMIVLTMNGDTRGDDIGEYVGTQPLDQAFISRFPIRKQLRYPSTEKLVQILQARNAGRLPDAMIQTISEVATELVAQNKFVPNLRELFACLDFLVDGIDLFHALKWTVGGIYKDDGTSASDYISFKATLRGKNINTDEN